MSEKLMTEVKVQLTAAMDTVLQGTLFEIMKIFQKALLDQQQQLAQKEEELVQLKIKLQTAELKLVALSSSDAPKVVEIPTQTEPNVEPPKQMPEFVEIDVQVPDDWCAPIGNEVPIKEEQEDPCPSVRLRAFSIPLWHVPIHEKETSKSTAAINPKPTSDVKRSKRMSAIKAKSKLLQKKNPTDPDLKSQSVPKRSDMKRLVKDMELVYSHQTGGSAPKRQKTLMDNKEQTKTKTDQSRSVEMIPSPNIEMHLVKKAPYVLKSSVHKRKQVDSCKIKQNDKDPKCSGTVKIKPKVEYTCRHCLCKCTGRSELSKHLRSHWFSCEMCSGRFSRFTSFKGHLKKKHNIITSLDDWIKDHDWTEPLENIDDNENITVSSSKKTAAKVVPSRVFDKDLSSIATKCPGGFSCLLCQKRLKARSSMIEHFRKHTREKSIHCNYCSAKYFYKSQLGEHMKRRHRDKL